ncbi:vWA domain-containing protein [Pseudohongiella spirulinae]|uniref:BatB protein n=1 Tax=Pseudohongiella spirulinae TaxID=1249552 RepID=A0A0S2KDW0_9GAMM|nr:VWA domain-containing protein [Pseudohongiella spirulinae]ALO46488.1 BatB protein [Pseudohongiella spirulinae]
MLEFSWPWVFLALPLPLIIYWLVPRAPRQDAALRVPFYRQLVQLHTDSSHQYNKNLFLLIACALIWLMVVIASSRPQWIGDPVQIPTTGRDMMLTLDMSGSMEARDMFLNNTQLSRFQVMKAVISDFVEKRTGDRLGLTLFAAHAYMLTPMTYDLATVQQMVDELEIGMIDESATAIGDAIGLSIRHLRQQPENNRILILLTDGINNAGELTPLQAAQLARTEGIKMHIVGVASDQFAQRSMFGTRASGALVSEIDDETMAEAAEMTGGLYFRARTLEDMISIYDELDQMEPIEQDEQTYRPETQLFHWPLGIALLLSFLLALSAMPAATRARAGDSV